ncbi:hypothetical protein pb186bvf_011683 [Paramecium bursaria]
MKLKSLNKLINAKKFKKNPKQLKKISSKAIQKKTLLYVNTYIQQKIKRCQDSKGEYSTQMKKQKVKDETQQNDEDSENGSEFIGKESSEYFDDQSEEDSQIFKFSVLQQEILQILFINTITQKIQHFTLLYTNI